MTELDLRHPTPERLAAALLAAGPGSEAVLRAFAEAAKPGDTVAYAAHLVDLVWAEEPAGRSPWHLYRGLRLALVASGPAWLGLAKLADLRAEHRLLAVAEALPELHEIEAFWRGHRHRRGAELLLIAEWRDERGRVWAIDGEQAPRMLAERTLGEPARRKQG